MKNLTNWSLSIFVAFVFTQSLFFKFSGAEETVIIFNTIGDWMASIGVAEFLSNSFANYGGYAVGTVELVSAALLLAPRTRRAGALLGTVVISGAIFFHLFTPLGVDRIVDAAGNTDGGSLFYTACAVLVANLWLIMLNRVSNTDENPETIEPQFV